MFCDKIFSHTSWYWSSIFTSSGVNMVIAFFYLAILAIDLWKNKSTAQFQRVKEKFLSKTDRSLLPRPVGIISFSRFALSHLSTTPLTGTIAFRSGHTTNGLVAFIGISPHPGSLRAALIA